MSDDGPKETKEKLTIAQQAYNQQCKEAADHITKSIVGNLEALLLQNPPEVRRFVNNNLINYDRYMKSDPDRMEAYRHVEPILKELSKRCRETPIILVPGSPTVN